MRRVNQQSLNVLHNALMYSGHGIVLLTDLTPPFLSPAFYSLTHYLCISISLSHTSHFSLNCIHFLTLSQLYFQSCSLPPLKVLSIFPSRLATLPVACLFIFHAFSFHSSLHHCISPLQRVLHAFLFFSLFFVIDASLSGRVCSEYLKPQPPPPPLWPTCPSCSMWRSRTLEPQFWAPLMSSACWDTTAMYPSWSKVGL